MNIERQIQALEQQKAELEEDVGRLDDEVKQAEKLVATVETFKQQQSAQQAAAARQIEKEGATQQAKAVKELKQADMRLAAGFSRLQETATKLRSAGGARALSLASEVGNFVSAEETILQQLQTRMQPVSALHQGFQVIQFPLLPVFDNMAAARGWQCNEAHVEMTSGHLSSSMCNVCC